MLGRGLFGGSTTARGATSDMLAALYVPEEQAEQPVLQLWSQPAVRWVREQVSHVSMWQVDCQPESHPVSHPASQK